MKQTGMASTCFHHDLQKSDNKVAHRNTSASACKSSVVILLGAKVLRELVPTITRREIEDFSTSLQIPRVWLYISKTATGDRKDRYHRLHPPEKFGQPMALEKERASSSSKGTTTLQSFLHDALLRVQWFQPPASSAAHAEAGTVAVQLSRCSAGRVASKAPMPQPGVREARARKD